MSGPNGHWFSGRGPEGARDVLFQVRPLNLHGWPMDEPRHRQPTPSASTLGIARPSEVQFESNDAKQNSEIEIPWKFHWPFPVSG
jgi:hypothetical protein